MKTRNVTLFILSLVMLIMAGCGGGGGGGVAASQGASVSGVASKGLIKNGTVHAFRIFSSHDPLKARIDGNPFFTGSTGLDGSYSIPIPSGMSKDGMLIRISGGTYLDEATQVEKNLADEYPNGMRAAFGNISGVVKRGEHASGSVTPFTEMALRHAQGLDDGALHQAEVEIEHAFGLDDKGIDIVHSKPLDPSVSHSGLDSTNDQREYTKALAILSQYEKDNSASGKKLNAISDDLVAEVETHNGALSASTVSGMHVSELNFDNSGNNKTGLPAGVAPVVLVSASKSAAVNNGVDKVLISATVTLSGAPVAGLEVKFAVKSGLGSISENSVLTDAAGKASTSLSSLVDGDADVVTASAGGISSDSPLVRFANPNKPGSVSLSANPSSGTTLANGGVTLTATVSPVSPSGSIANGTVVVFSITSGSGTLSAISTTTNGVATATLSALSANTVTVTASAGSAISSPLSVPFVNQPTKAILKISSAGVPSGSLIGGLNLLVTLPAGVTVAKNADNSTASGVVVASGAASAAGALAVGNAGTAGQISIGMITTSGFGAGEFVTINADIAAGNFPKASDFGVSLNGNVINTLGAIIPNVSLSLSAAIQ